MRLFKIMTQKDFNFLKIIFSESFGGSHKRCSIKKLFLKILQYSLKTSVLESLFNKVTGLHPCNLTKKRLLHSCFPVNIVKFLRTPILKKICKQLFMKHSLLK